jgi:hypothetical protein
MGTGSLLREQSGWSVEMTTHPYLAPELKSRAIPLLPLRAYMACSRVKFTFFTSIIFKTNKKSFCNVSCPRNRTHIALNRQEGRKKGRNITYQQQQELTSSEPSAMTSLDMKRGMLCYPI